MKACILAAGYGSRLRPYTDTVPKALVPVGAKPMLQYILDTMKEFDFEEYVVVTGYKEEEIRKFWESRTEKVTFIYNERYEDLGNYYSLLCAEKHLTGFDFFKIDSDLIFESQIPRNLVASEGDLRISVEVRDNMGEEEMKVKIDESGKIIDFSKEIPPREAWGESIGIEFVTAAGSAPLFNELRAMFDEGAGNAYYEEAYGRLARKNLHVHAVKVTAQWIEIDNKEDLENAEKLFG